MQLDDLSKASQLTLEDQFEMEKFRQAVLHTDTVTASELIVRLFRLYIQYKRMTAYLIKTSLKQEQPVNGNRL
jgi:hypothetical protein